LNKKVNKGKTLLVDGPASVTVQSGVAEVFGFHVNVGQRVVVRAGKRLPFAVEEQADFEVALGPEGAVDVVEGDTVPVSWPNAYSAVVAIEKKPVTVMVVGGVDSGKTSFCTYLANRLVSRNCRVALVDEDLGQSDIGPQPPSHMPTSPNP
jgi:polynucleotide 5'-hydroxyl-kinase GRC3/NOL9